MDRRHFFQVLIGGVALAPAASGLSPGLTRELALHLTLALHGPGAVWSVVKHHGEVAGFEPTLIARRRP